MSEILSPDLAKRLKGASPEVKLKAAELLEQAKQAQKIEERPKHLYGLRQAHMACIY